MRSSILVLCIIISSIRINAQDFIPDTKMGQAIKTWINLFNQRDSSALVSFYQNNLSEELIQKEYTKKCVEGNLWVRSDFGKIVPYSIKVKGGNELKLKVHNKSMTRWLNVRFKFSSDENCKITSYVSFLTCTKPRSVKIEKLDDNDLAADVKKFVTQSAFEGDFSGTVLIANNGVPFFVESYGDANIEKKISNNNETKYGIASLNKMMTGLAIAQLVQAGRLNYSDLVSKHLPNYPNKEVAENVTIQQLLSHTSGLGDVFTEEWGKKIDSVRNVSDWFEFFVNNSLLFRPGKGFNYSNAAYVVLGAIIEKVSGTDYYTYIRENITKPLGMNNTEFYSKSDVVDNMAEGYYYKNAANPKLNNINTRPFRGFPAGGGYSTVSDLLKFGEAIRSMKLIDEKHTKLMTSKIRRIIPFLNVGYALGFLEDERDGTRMVGHEGGSEGVSADFNIYWDSGYTVIVLSNFDPHAAEQVSNYVKMRIKE
jgi:CubicO group peptidase (beta-lactamase class C family)